jgi:hypothetical protein
MVSQDSCTCQAGQLFAGQIIPIVCAETSVLAETQSLVAGRARSKQLTYSEALLRSP